MSTAIVCIASNITQAQVIIDELRMTGFSRNEISLLMADEGSMRDLAVEKHSKAPEGTSTGAGAGALAGGALGWLVGIGSITIPGAGLFVAAGPLMAALGGAAVGSALGGVTGGLIGLGIPEYEAKQFAGKLDEGSILISIHAENEERASTAEGILKNCAAHDIHRVHEESVRHGRSAA